MLRMKKVLKGIIRGLDHIVNFIALSLILAAMFLSGYMLWDSHQVYQTADAKNYEAYIPTEKSTKSFEELQKINPDVIGWIRVNDTNINYPLVQTDNDDTYMNTDAEGNYSLSGAIFLHCANKPDFSDFDNIIYGHHMEKHMMFGDIGEFTKEQYFNEHPYGNLFFDGKDHGIEFYALMQVDAYNETIFNVCPDTSEAKQAYLLEIIDNALYKRELNITEDDHLVLLTTCTSDMTNGRNVLVGRLTDKVYPEKEKAKNLGTGIDQLKDRITNVPVIIWMILIIIVLLLCGGAILFIYYPDLFSSSSDKNVVDIPEVTQPVQPEAQLSDTIAHKDTVVEAVQPQPVVKKEPTAEPVKAESKPAQQQPTASAYSDSASYKITGTKTKYTIKEGETLTKVSLRFYGTKAMWPYIVKHNPKVIKNPDNVPYGTTIEIPELTKE